MAKIIRNSGAIHHIQGISIAIQEALTAYFSTVFQLFVLVILNYCPHMDYGVQIWTIIAVANLCWSQPLTLSGIRSYKLHQVSGDISCVCKKLKAIFPSR